MWASRATATSYATLRRLVMASWFWGWRDEACRSIREEARQHAACISAIAEDTLRHAFHRQTRRRKVASTPASRPDDH
jgi:hypothetical protein